MTKGSRRRRPGPAWLRCVAGSVLVLGVVALCAAPAQAQDGFYVEGSGDYSSVDVNTTPQTWKAGRLSGGFIEEGRSGWNVTLDRQTRASLADWGVTTRGFRRTGDWTFSGGFGLGVDPIFTPRRSFEGEVARTITGTLVGHGGYRYLGFNNTTVHLIQPGATYYMPHGDIGARLIIVRNATRQTTTSTVLIQGGVIVNPRLRLGGGAAFGERIFDVASLATPHADAWVGYGFAHVTLTPSWALDIGTGRSHEDPAFTQGTLTMGVRWTFGGRP